MKIQIAKLYRGDRFIGYGIAVNGELLAQQVSTSIESDAHNLPTIKAIFNLDAELAENQVTIDLNKR